MNTKNLLCRFKFKLKLIIEELGCWLFGDGNGARPLNLQISENPNPNEYYDYHDMTFDEFTFLYTHHFVDKCREKIYKDILNAKILVLGDIIPFFVLLPWIW